MLPLLKDKTFVVSDCGDPHLGWALMVILVGLTSFLLFILGPSIHPVVNFLFSTLPVSVKMVVDGDLASFLLVLAADISDVQVGFYF